MSVTALVEREQQSRDDAPDELLIYEAASLVPESLRAAIIARADARGIKQPPGTELLQLLRPGVGLGRGRHYYSPRVVEASASAFRGARMFLNHETEKERREREGLPRKVEHVGGRIIETWWDGDVPASDRFEQGGLYAWTRPVRYVRDLIDDDPELLETSISALATSKTPGRRNGQTCQIVEGIRATPKPSVDWIAGEGGAGGKVLREAKDEEEAVLDTMSDDEVRDWLQRERPELVEALNDPDGDGDNDAPEIAARAKKHMAKGKSRAEALALARQEIASAGSEVKEAAVELSEVLASEEGQQAIAAAVQEAMSNFQPFDADAVERLVESRVEARLAESADLLRLETAGDFERKTELRDMRERAYQLVQEAESARGLGKLHPLLAGKIREKFALDERGVPTDALNIGPDTDEEGNIVRPAMEKLVEAVTEEIEDARKLRLALGERSAVRGQGGATAARVTENADGVENGGGEQKPTSGSDVADDFLTGAGIKPEQLGKLWSAA